MTTWQRTGILLYKKYFSNLSFQNVLSKTNFILINYDPKKEASKQKLKLKTKPLITTGIPKSTSEKNKLLSNFEKLKDASFKK